MNEVIPLGLKEGRYIGDGVYVGRDDCSRVWLLTAEGDQICLEPQVLKEFLAWLRPSEHGNLNELARAAEETIWTRPPLDLGTVKKPLSKDDNLLDEML